MQKKVEETDVVMAEVEHVSHQYLPLSTACSSIYFTLESLNQVAAHSVWYDRCMSTVAWILKGVIAETFQLYMRSLLQMDTKRCVVVNTAVS